MEGFTLSTQQHDAILAFLEKKGLQYYDLQLEMADHFACMLEAAALEAEDEFEFSEELLEDIYQQFQDPGFKRLISDRKYWITKRNHALGWQFVKASFFGPRLILTVALIFSIYQILIQTANPTLLYAGIGLSFLLLWGIMSWVFFSQRPLIGKKLLTTQSISGNFTLLILFLYLPLAAIPIEGYELLASEPTLAACMATYLVWIIWMVFGFSIYVKYQALRLFRRQLERLG